MKGILATLLIAVAIAGPQVCVAQSAQDASSEAAAATDDVSPRVEALAAREPAVEDVRAAAVRYAGLDPGRARSWARRARLSGLLPTFTARMLRATGRDQGLKLSEGSTDYLKIDTGDDLVLELRATWDLKRLAFDGSELRSAREGARQAGERRRLESEVTRLYYQRRRAQIEWILDPPADAADRARRTIEMDELTAQLDAMTGGWFSREIARMAEE